MAQSWYHEFNPDFPGLIIVLAISLLVVAYFIGRISVKIVPRKVREKQPENPEYADMPVWHSKKAAKVRESFRRSYLRRLELSDSVVLMQSETRDYIFAVIEGAVFAKVFYTEHWLGLVQFCINNLSANDDAVYGDFMAVIILVSLSGAEALACYAISRIAQMWRAEKLAGKYVHELHRRPVISEQPHLGYYVKVLAWVAKKAAGELFEKLKKAKEETPAKVVDFFSKKAV